MSDGQNGQNTLAGQLAYQGQMQQDMASMAAQRAAAIAAVRAAETPPPPPEKTAEQTIEELHQKLAKADSARVAAEMKLEKVTEEASRKIADLLVTVRTQARVLPP